MNAKEQQRKRNNSTINKKIRFLTKRFFYNENLENHAIHHIKSFKLVKFMKIRQNK